MRHFGPVVRVDLEDSALARRNARAREIQGIRVALSSGRDEHTFGADRPPRREREDDLITRGTRALLDLLFPDELDTRALHRSFEGVRDVAVEEREELVTRVDQPDPRAESGEGARVFAADDSRANHDEAPRNPSQVEDLVRVVNP